MIKMSFKMPSQRDLIKMATAAAEEKITQTARRAASPYGGVRVRFDHKPDGSLAAVNFEGSEKAVQAARHAVAS